MMMSPFVFGMLILFIEQTNERKSNKQTYKQTNKDFKSN